MCHCGAAHPAGAAPALEVSAHGLPRGVWGWIAASIVVLLAGLVYMLLPHETPRLPALLGYVDHTPSPTPKKPVRRPAR